MLAGGGAAARPPPPPPPRPSAFCLLLPSRRRLPPTAPLVDGAVYRQLVLAGVVERALRSTGCAASAPPAHAHAVTRLQAGDGVEYVDKRKVWQDARLEPPLLY